VLEVAMGTLMIIDLYSWEAGAATVATPSSSDRPLSVTIVAVPRGCQYNSATGMIVYPDGTEADPPPFTPFTPTPELEPAPEPVVAADPVSEPVVEDAKLAILDLHRRKRGDDGAPPAA
jgi:hypothetical protein